MDWMLTLSPNIQQSTYSYDLHIHVQAAKAYEENITANPWSGQAANLPEHFSSSTISDRRLELVVTRI